MTDNEITTYEELMADSESRKKIVTRLVNFVKNKTPQRIHAYAIDEIRLKLRYFDVEDGVSIFFTQYNNPSGLEKIAEIDNGLNNIILWWGENLQTRHSSYPNKYALGISFKPKEKGEIMRYTSNEFTHEFPDFSSIIFENFKVGDAPFTLTIYSKAGFFYRDVKSLEGKWLLQEPNEKGNFIPYRPIGMICENSVHIFVPKNNMKKEKEIRKVQFI